MLGNKMGDDGIAAVAALLRRTKALGELEYVILRVGARRVL